MSTLIRQISGEEVASPSEIRCEPSAQYLLVTLRDSFPLIHLKVSCPIFLYSFPPTFQRLHFEACFNPSPLAGRHQNFFQIEIAQLGLMGVKRVLPSASVKN